MKDIDGVLVMCSLEGVALVFPDAVRMSRVWERDGDSELVGVMSWDSMSHILAPRSESDSDMDSVIDPFLWSGVPDLDRPVNVLRMKVEESEMEEVSVSRFFRE